MEKLVKSFEQIKTVHPYVHHITNGVTMTYCANMTLAIGGSPAMAHSVDEVEEMVANMHALVLNPGTPCEERVQAMLLAGKRANALGIPVVLDPVAAGATGFRKKINTKLIEEVAFAVIRGNASEIMTLAGVSSGRGVDVSHDLTFDEAKVMRLARTLKTVIATSGEVDFITDGQCKVYCENGVAMLSEITGTGCMIASLIGAGVGAGNDPIDAAILASAVMGIAGEQAYATVAGERKLGTFSVALFDAVGMMSRSTLESEAKITDE